MAARARLLWAPVWMYMAVIYVMSSFPAPEVVDESNDKILHALAYGVMSLLIVRALSGAWQKPIGWATACAAVAIATAHGVTDEFHQWFVPSRSLDPIDAAADA